MSANLQELYQDIILEHNRNPHNKHKSPDCNNCHEGYNPSCGDVVTICMVIEDNVIKDISFTGEGCAISQASASLMTDLLVGKTRSEALKIINDVCSSLCGGNGDLSKYGDVCALTGVTKFPMRIKCATLSWHAAESLLHEE
ncbi:MAG: SUF system NifU family Fe-S cluster assembly protein [Opitutales bacterium]|nr:SUF system NifU family Fe-S cluster assembly protein [Opitutales bacterium]